MRHQKDADGHQAWANRHGVKEQALERFPDDVHRREKQQRGFHERRKAFHFSVAVEMLRVGGLVRDANGEICDDCGDQIENGMQCFGENAQAARRDREKNLQRNEYDGRSHRAERRHSLFTSCESEWFRGHSGDYTLGALR